MSGLLNKLMGEAIAQIEEMSTRFLKSAVLLFWGLGALLISVALLTLGLFDFLQPIEGDAGAALSLGGFYLVIGIIFIIFTLRQNPHKGRDVASAQVEKEGLPPQPAEFAKNIESAVTPILAVLRDAGMERERVAIESVSELAKQLHPFSLVSFAMLAGLIFGRVITKDQRRPPS